MNISGRIAGELALVHVADNGLGVPASDRNRVFEPFFTSRRATGGSGLGLAIAQSLLKASSGGLDLVDSEVGTEFVIGIPLFPDDRSKLSFNSEV